MPAVKLGFYIWFDAHKAYIQTQHGNV